MEITSRILIVDDNASIHRDFKKVLCRSKKGVRQKLSSIEKGLFDESDEIIGETVDSHQTYEVDSAYQGKEALDMVAQSYEEGRPYAMIFMDVRMPPGWDGVETVRRIWEKYPEVEVVICTAFSDYSWEKILSNLGITDHLLFLRKPFDTTAVKQMALSQTRKWHLAQEAQRYVKQLENEIKVRKASEERLQYLAHHDSLTGLANRTKFNLLLTQTLREASLADRRLAVLFVDLDRFKEFNDTLGYHNGDLLLRQFAQRLVALMGDETLVARFGGDEFTLLLADIDTQDDAIAEVRRIKHALLAGFEVEGLQLEVQASVGVVFYPDHGQDSETLMRRGDMTASMAKNSALGFTVYDPKYDHYNPRRLMLLGELRLAIQENKLDLFYQPKISLRTGRTIGVEALVRWNHPKLGRIFPDEFVPLAERSGLIKPLSMWVLGEAPKLWRELHDNGIDLTFSINLSTRDLFDMDMPTKVKQLLSDNGMPAESLVLEITESAMMEEPDLARLVLDRLSRMGVRLAIDDFGTGYSSLAYLKNLPVHEIKIDKSFVLEMDQHRDDETIVKSTIDLGHTLNMLVVAEGVEKQEPLNMLERLGCDFVQGFFMSRPVPKGELIAFLKESPWGWDAPPPNDHASGLHEVEP